jgi:hypothetical protein
MSNSPYFSPPNRRGVAGHDDEEMMMSVSPSSLSTKRRTCYSSPPAVRSLLLDIIPPPRTDSSKPSSEDAAMSLYSPIESSNNVDDDDDDDEDDYGKFLDELSSPRSNESTSTPADDVEDDVEDDNARRRREEEESLELCRTLMAEEAMASYHHHFQLIRDNGELSQEDREALQAAIDEDERELQEEQTAELEQDEEGNMSYETMLQLGERIGDVKSERWTMVAQKHIAKLPVFSFQTGTLAHSDEHKEENDSDVKCLVCQCDYEQDEDLRRLPCGHCFHSDCVGQWLAEKDFCPYCRQTIVSNSDDSPHQH